MLEGRENTGPLLKFNCKRFYDFLFFFSLLSIKEPSVIYKRTFGLFFIIFFFLPENIHLSGSYSLPILWLSWTISCTIKSGNHSTKRDPFGKLYIMLCSNVRKGQVRLQWLSKLDLLYHKLNLLTENLTLSSRVMVFLRYSSHLGKEYPQWLLTQNRYIWRCF